MRKYEKVKYIVSLVLAFCILTSSASALTFDGATTGGSGGNVSASGGYAVEYTDNTAVGYRFSVVDENGMRRGTVIDVFKRSLGTDYLKMSKFSNKLSKYDLLRSYQSKFSTVAGEQAHDYYDTTHLNVTLPSKTDGMKSWQGKESNLNPVLQKIGNMAVTDLYYGDKVLIEPLWNVKIEGTPCVFTVTEIGVYGGARFGFDTAPKSSNTQGSWGFIAKCTNRVFPNALYTPNGQGLWSGVSSAAGSNLSFKNMIIKGYGVAIAYTANSNCKVAVTYNPNGGSVFSSTGTTTKTYDINQTITLPTPTRSQYSCKGWYTASSSGSKYGNAGSSYTVTKNITMYAQWNMDGYTIRYYNDSNGGGHNDKYNQYVVYGTATILRNYKDIGYEKYGYHFLGYNVYRTQDNCYIGYNSSGELKWINKADICTDYGYNGYELYCKNGATQAVAKTAHSGYVHMTAMYEPNNFTVKYNPNADGNQTVDDNDFYGVTGTMADTVVSYGTSTLLRKNVYVRQGYTFGGWIAFREYDKKYFGYNTSGVKGWYVKSDICTDYGYNGYELYCKNNYTQSVAATAPEGIVYMFAVWSKNPYVIKYNPNADGDLTVNSGDFTGITGTMADTTVGDGYVVLTANNFYRSKSSFGGWIAGKTVSGVQYYFGFNTDDDYSGLSTTAKLVKADWYTVDEIRTYFIFANEYSFNRTLSNGEAVYMFAVWNNGDYTIKFNANSPDAVGTMNNITCSFYVKYKLTKNAFTITNKNFVGWFAVKSAAGKMYGYNSSGTLGWWNTSDIKDTYIFADTEEIYNLGEARNDVIEMYAKWVDGVYTVIYNSNGGTGSMDNSVAEENQVFSLRNNEFYKSGYEFYGWVNGSNGSMYYNKQEVENLTALGGVVNLYAIWQPIQYKITFNSNGGTGSMDNMNCTYDYGYNLTANSFTRDGYMFVGWINGSNGHSYNDIQDVRNLSDIQGAVITLYAMWAPIQYKVAFNPNGGTGSMDNMNCTYDYGYNLTANSFTRDDYTFVGWINGSNGHNYTDTQEIRNLSDVQGAVITLYAQWQQNLPSGSSDIGIVANEIYGNIKQGYYITVSAVVENNGDIDIIPDIAATVRLICSNKDGDFSTQTQKVIVPKNNVQLVWFEVLIPSRSEEDVHFSFEIIPYKTISDDNLSNNNSDISDVATVYYISNTKIPEYQTDPDSLFSKYVNSCGRTKDTFTWQFWVWDNENFVLKTEQVNLEDTYTVILKPAASAGWKQQDGDNYKTRSGYGIDITAKFILPGNLSVGTLRLDVLYPEFNYRYNANEYTSMNVIKNNDITYSADLPYNDIEKYKKSHFTPMWYPNKDYSIEIHGSGLWTPIGEMHFTAAETNTLTIEGSLWDDYYSTFYGNTNKN